MKYILLNICLFLALAPSLGQDQTRLLMEAYRSNSPEKLRSFFDSWARESLPLSSKDIGRLNDSVQEVYSVFKEFYNPLEIERTGGSEWGNDIYKKVGYLVVQDHIRIGFVDTLDKELIMRKEYGRLACKLHISADSVAKGYKTERLIMRNFRFEWPTPEKYITIYGFRPRVSFKSPKTVVLTGAYDSLLNGFMGNSHYSFGTGNIMSPATSKGESASRQKFLENCIRVWYGHWGGYWQLYSYPYVDAIILDKTLSNALVNYRLIYEGGYAYFKKVNGSWTLMEAGRTWIE